MVLSFYIEEKMRKFILLISIFILASCALFQPHEFSRKQEILKWDNFKLEGIIEVNYKSFSLRKNIVIEKKTDSGKLTIFESGLFGLSPQPLISVSYKDGKLKRKNLPPELLSQLPISEIDLLFNLNNLVEKANITSNKAVFEDYVITFKNNKLSSLQIKEKKIDFKYSSNKPVEIVFLTEDQEIGKILIDKIIFG